MKDVMTNYINYDYDGKPQVAEDLIENYLKRGALSPIALKKTTKNLEM